MIAIGETAPDFTLPATVPGADGIADSSITLSALRPQKVVLYFYPRDNTPGCTIEATGFTRLAEDFRKAGAVIVGVSRDSMKKHESFCTKHSLGIVLASDEDGKVCEAYGTWGEKILYGRISLGIKRTTFLIDSAGKVAKVWPKVSVKTHPEEVLEAVRALG